MQILTVDAFTNKPFSGNPAAVCIQEKPLEESLMQKIANEMNLAETAFLYPFKDGYHLRWFTPETEVRLCGHATLASAHTLWEKGYLPEEKMATFHTLSGELTARKQADWIELNFPAIFSEKIPAPDYLEKALGTAIKEVFFNKEGYMVVEVEHDSIVREVKPDFNALLKTNALVMVTAKSSTSEFDFISRVFAPCYGINEDPVTGAAHCCLAVYWSKKLDKKELVAYQASKRGGLLKLRLEENRVKLIGQAVTVLEGQIKVEG